MKILIIKPSSLGDIVHCFPAVELIRRNVPDAELTWVVNDSLAEMVRLMPCVGRIIPFPRKAIGRGSLSALRQFLRELRRDSYDLVIDFQGLLRSGLMAFCSRSRQRIGFANAREGAPFFYHRRIEVPPELLHAVEKNVHLARTALNLDPSLGVPVPDFDLSQVLAASEGLLSPDNPETPWLAVGFSSRWPSKNWPVSFFISVLQAVKRELPELRCWLLGSPAEKALGDSIADQLSPDWCLNMAGRTNMLSLTGLLARSRALLTNDSGPMHIAAALQIPCMALFGATDPRLTGPYGKDLHTVIRSRCPQSPCFQRNCPRASRGVLCSDQLDPEEIARRLASVIRSRTPRQSKYPLRKSL